MTTAIKCKHCGRIIVRNARDVWVLPHSKFPSNVCLDGIHSHEPDRDPNNPTGTVTAIAVGASVFDAGLI